MTIEVPRGRPDTWADFAAWYARMRHFKLRETVGISFHSPDGDAAVGGFSRHRRG